MTLRITLRRCLALYSMALMMASAQAADDLNVRFSWKLKGEYAHLYLAQEQGMYTEQNLNVRMGEGAGAPAALGALLQGQEDVVIMPAIFAISAVQKGMPIKIIALYHAKTPVVLISHAEKAVLQPKDLEGKTVAHSVGETGTSYLSVLCEINKIDCAKVRKIQMDSQSRFAQFVQKQVDVVSVYANNDLPILEARTGIKYPVLDLAKFGLAFPGLAAVSSDAVIAKKGDALKRYLAATNKAIAATRANPSVAATAMSKVWQGAPSMSIVEAQVRSTMSALSDQAGKPMGWVDAKIITQALDLLKTEEAIGSLKPVEVFFSNDLLPKQ